MHSCLLYLLRNTIILLCNEQNWYMSMSIE